MGPGAVSKGVSVSGRLPIPNSILRPYSAGSLKWITTGATDLGSTSCRSGAMIVTVPRMIAVSADNARLKVDTN